MRLFPRGDCAERCVERLTHLPAWRWAKCLITRADFPHWRLDVEFVASLCNIFVRREQISAVEASLSVNYCSPADFAEMEKLIAAGLVAHALASGDVNSVRELLRKKDLDSNIQKTFRRLQFI